MKMVSLTNEVKMAKKAKKFIQKAIKHPGALTNAAQAAGKTVAEFCQSSNLSATNRKRCNLRETLMGFNKK